MFMCLSFEKGEISFAWELKELGHRSMFQQNLLAKSTVTYGKSLSLFTAFIARYPHRTSFSYPENSESSLKSLELLWQNCERHQGHAFAYVRTLVSSFCPVLMSLFQWQCRRGAAFAPQKHRVQLCTYFVQND